MMTLHKITKSGKAAWAYASDVKEGSGSEADYYEGTGSPSRWHGNGAAALKLSGRVKKEDLIGLLDNGAPGQKIQEVRRKATDVTFSAPKSVSIAALGLGDDGIKAAHDAAVKEALDYIQQEVVQARYGTGGTRKENTNSALIAVFQHEDARPVDGQVDMNLHSHSLIINSTQDEHGWRGLDLDWGKNSVRMHTADAIYKAALAEKLQAMGYGIEKTKDGFEIAGITKKMRDSQSHRTGQIEQEIQARGTSREDMTAAERYSITAATRAEKRHVTKADLRECWQSDCRNMGLIRESVIGHQSTKNQVPIHPVEAITVAIAHLSERQRVWSKDQLILEALKYGVGSVTIHEIRQAITNHPDLIEKGNGQYTTTEAAEQDGWLEAYAKNTRGTLSALQAQEQVDATIHQIEQQQGFKYGDGQREAVKLALTSVDKITGIVGAAGAGKTTAMAGIVAVAHAAGMEIIGLAPTAAAASELSDARADSTKTIASFISAQDADVSPAGRLVILDEAGMVGTDDMQKVLEKLHKNDRLLLVGDPKQLRSVAAGNAYADYLANNSIQYAEINEIKRQKDPELLAIAEAFARGQPEEAAEKAQKYMHEVEPEMTGKDAKGKPTATKADKIKAIVDQATSQYLSLTPEDRAQTITLAVQNDLRKAINQRIRAGLVAEGAVAKNGTEIQVVHAADMTTAHRKQAHKYSEGGILREIGRNGTHTDWRITAIDGEHNRLTLRSGEREKTVDPSDLNTRSWRVYEQKTMEVSAGDKLVMLENNNQNKLYNGNLLDVQSIEDGKIYGTLASGEPRVIDVTQPQNIDLAYCLTVHKSQGKTVSNTIFAALSTTQTSAEAAYVAMSREKYRLSIITDSAAALGKKIIHWSERDTAATREESMDAVNHGKMDEALQHGARQAATHLHAIGQEPNREGVLHQNSVSGTEQITLQPQSEYEMEA
jgi:conjugative relaxase-like TrwC/TraI family protein